MPTTTAYIGLGSNLGDRAGYLLLGVRGMMNAGLGVARLSSIYETEPVDRLTNDPLDGEAQPLYLNMVAELHGVLPPSEQLLTRLLRIEYALGRRRSIPHGLRTIDLDLLLYGDEQQASELLTLPHPRLHLRRFVLAPLVELIPYAEHPVLHQTFSELLADAKDNSTINLWQPLEQESGVRSQNSE